MKSITLTATDQAWDTSRPGFLRANPVPTEEVLDEAGKPTGERQPTMSDGAWVKNRLVAYYDREKRHGLELIAKDAVQSGKTFT